MVQEDSLPSSLGNTIAPTNTIINDSDSSNIIFVSSLSLMLVHCLAERVNFALSTFFWQPKEAHPTTASA